MIYFMVSLWYLVGVFFSFATIKSFGPITVRDLFVCLLSGWLGPIMIICWVVNSKAKFLNKELF